jgi:hypothetical protein
VRFFTLFSVEFDDAASDAAMSLHWHLDQRDSVVGVPALPPCCKTWMASSDARCSATLAELLCRPLAIS